MTTKRKSGGKKADEERSESGGGIFSSLTGFINNLGDLADAGERLSQRRASNRDTGGKEHTGEKGRGREPFRPHPERFDGHRRKTQRDLGERGNRH